ncbi:hypothetical protein SAMN05518865_110174 [Duganella sp. CF458]|uniref:hypothetical protein n=1 Tax=Duganella sp. CF458 TaxID=1884368 RepID=UPI0008E036D3|nr:hypothetical protein [Duganella sp. CF458]SFG29745.1 hypothetical protein SAMN05518865_110174 [Duganella sp. CF458]
MKFKVNWQLDTGVKQYEAGDTVDMKEADAAQLVASGVLTPAGKVVEPGADGAGGAGNE